MLREGDILGGIYRIIAPIGEGGLGQVFLAWHERLQKQVVVKRIKQGFTGDLTDRAEADILKSLKHRNLPQVYDFIRNGEEVYTVMDYIDGNTLDDYIRAQVRFDEVQMIRWIKQLLDALEYLHAQNPMIIHSDIKPSNIMIDRDGEICLIDFNISLDGSMNTMVSGYSPSYASPEQMYLADCLRRGTYDPNVYMGPQSDIYSLGATLFHFMSLQNPKALTDAGYRLEDIQLPYSELLCEALHKAMQPDPAKRYQSAADMRKALESMKYRDRRYRHLNRSHLVYNLFFTALLIGGAFLIARGSVVMNEERFEAAYEAVTAEKDTASEEELIEDCLAVLNERKYEKLLEDHNSEKANLLLLIADAYFDQEDYENAAEFYARAKDCGTDNPEIFRDYAIVLARTGEIEKAEKVLKEARKLDIESIGLSLAEGEIAMAKDDTEEAIDCFLRVIDSGEEGNGLGRAYVLCAEAYRKAGEYQKASDLLEEGYEKLGDHWKIRILREQGSTCIEYIEAHENEPVDDWIERAKECYEILTEQPTAVYLDWMNLVRLYEMQGDYAKADEVLEKMSKQYPDDYRVPMNRAMIALEAESGKDKDARDYQAAARFHQEAEELYAAAENDGEQDPEMTDLRNLMDELKEKGWL